MARSSKTLFQRLQSKKRPSRSTTGRSSPSKTARPRSKAPSKKPANTRSTPHSAGPGAKQPISPFRTFLVASTLGALSALGFWRCFDGSDTSPLDPYEPRLSQVAPQEVDVGEGKEVDPTLLNEKQLLEEEKPSTVEPKREQAPDKGREPEEADTDEEARASQEDEDETEDEPQPEQIFPMHAVAFHFHTQVKAEPAADGHVTGYFRRGTQFKVSQRLSTKGCERGWYEVSPGGYYVCNGVGVIVSDEPVTFAPSPVQPNLNSTLPYEYRFVSKNDTPQYWRMPTPQEAAEVAGLFDRLSQAEKDAGLDKRGLEEVLKRAAELGQMEDAPAPSAELLAGAEAPDTSGDGDGDTDTEDPDAFPPYLHLRMARGFYVSIDDLVESEAGKFRRTVRGRFIPEDRMAKAQPSSFEGVLLTGERSLPLVFVVGSGVKLLRQDEPDGPLKDDRRVERYEVLPHLGEMTRKNRHYVRVGDGLYLSDRVAAAAQLSPPPADLEEHERWIDIDLSEQTLVAYEGAEPVFATIMSSGRKDYETPTGDFRIYGKHVSITMDDTAAGEESYSIEDVPWTQYFQDGYALHTAFWHDRFGRVRSHGCINLSPSDAHRLFNWTGPRLEGELHGVVATQDNPGTRIVVHE